MRSLLNSNTSSSRITPTSTMCSLKTSSPSRWTWNRKVRPAALHFISHPLSHENVLSSLFDSWMFFRFRLRCFSAGLLIVCPQQTQSEVTVLMSTFPWNGLWWKLASPQLAVRSHGLIIVHRERSQCLGTLHSCSLSIQRAAHCLWPLIWCLNILSCSVAATVQVVQIALYKNLPPPPTYFLYNFIF